MNADGTPSGTGTVVYESPEHAQNAIGSSFSISCLRGLDSNSSCFHVCFQQCTTALISKETFSKFVKIVLVPLEDEEDEEGSGEGSVEDGVDLEEDSEAEEPIWVARDSSNRDDNSVTFTPTTRDLGLSCLERTRRLSKGDSTLDSKAGEEDSEGDLLPLLEHSMLLTLDRSPALLFLLQLKSLSRT